MIAHSDIIGRDEPAADNLRAFRETERLIAGNNGERLRASIATLTDLPDHADAFASVLEYYAARIRAGGNTEDLAVQLLPVVRIAARRI